MSPVPDAAERRRRGFGEGPLLVAAGSLVVLALCALVLASEGSDEQGLRALVRTTARVALVFFLAAYVASSLRRLWRVPATAWLLRNRRYVGLSFAVAHAAHAVAIGLLALLLGDAFRTEPVSLAGGGLGYLFTAALAATSSDRAVAWLGAARWRLLHRVGVHWLWLIFAVTEIPAALRSPVHFALAALVVAGAGTRIAALRVGRGTASTASAVAGRADRMR